MTKSKVRWEWGGGAETENIGSPWKPVLTIDKPETNAYGFWGDLSFASSWLFKLLENADVRYAHIPNLNIELNVERRYKATSAGLGEFWEAHGSSRGEPCVGLGEF